MTGVSFEEYLQLLAIAERLGELGVSGPYSARKTLKLLDGMTPPYKWIFPGVMSDIDAGRSGYREMAGILESVRKGNLYSQYDDSPDHIVALVDRVEHGRVSNRELLHYLYSRKNSGLEETFGDKVVNLLLVYLLTYSMSLGSEVDIKHSDVLDLLLSDTNINL